MNELKTLNDLYEKSLGQNGSPRYLRYLIKAEAIKKVNFIREEGRLPDGSLLNDAESFKVCRFIMWDNNLKEEDLK